MGTTHVQREIQRNQMNIEEFFEIKFPSKKIELDDSHADYLKRTLDTLNSLHSKKKLTHRWQEMLASYEILRHENGGAPSEKEVAEFMNLKDHRIGRTSWIGTAKRMGYHVEFQRTVPRSEVTMRRVRAEHDKMKECSTPVMAKDIARKAGISPSWAADCMKDMSLDFMGRGSDRRNHCDKKLLNAYNELIGNLPPTIEEVAELSGLSKSHVCKSFRRLGLVRLRDSDINKKSIIASVAQLQPYTEAEELAKYEIKFGKYKEPPNARQVSGKKPKHALPTTNTENIIAKASSEGLSYFRIREMNEQLCRNGMIEIPYSGGNDAEKYAKFLRDNYEAICQSSRVPQNPGKIVMRENEGELFYVLKFSPQKVGSV